MWISLMKDELQVNFPDDKVITTMKKWIDSTGAVLQVWYADSCS